MCSQWLKTGLKVLWIILTFRADAPCTAVMVEPCIPLHFRRAYAIQPMQAGDLQKACAIAQDDPSSDLVPTQVDFQERVQSLAAQLLQVNMSTVRLLLCLA